MSKLHKTKMLLKTYGFHALKANKLHKAVYVLDKKAQSLTENADAYWANRKECWKITRMLIKLEVR